MVTVLAELEAVMVELVADIPEKRESPSFPHQ